MCFFLYPPSKDRVVFFWSRGALFALPKTQGYSAPHLPSCNLTPLQAEVSRSLLWLALRIRRKTYSDCPFGELRGHNSSESKGPIHHHHHHNTKLIRRKERDKLFLVPLQKDDFGKLQPDLPHSDWTNSVSRFGNRYKSRSLHAFHYFFRQ